MITLPVSDARRTHIQGGGTLVPVFLVTLSVGDDTYRLTDHDTDVSVGGQSYTATPDLLRTSHPTHREDQTRDFWTLEFAESSAAEVGMENQWQHRFAAVGHRSVTAEIALVFRDPDGRDFTLPLTVYRGRLAELQTAANDTGIVTTAGFTGPLTRLDNEFARYTSHESQRQVDENDTAFLYAHEGAEVRVEWRG